MKLNFSLEGNTELSDIGVHYDVSSGIPHRSDGSTTYMIVFRKISGNLWMFDNNYFLYLISTVIDQYFTLGDELILPELIRRIVEHRHIGACRSKNRPLLTAAAGETEHVTALQLRKPVGRHRFGWGENDRELTLSRLADGLRIDGQRPPVAG